MKELQIKISQEPAVIRCNFEDVKAQLSAKMAEYQGAVFTEESKSVAKAELASLRKTRDEIEKRRKEVKAQCLVPYNDFEEKVKELLEIIDEPICLIDGQLKEMEAERIRYQQEEEQRRQAEIERAREEERRKLEEIAKAREEERKKAEEALKAAAMETPEPEVPFSLDDAEDGDDLPFPQPQTVTMWYKIIATPDELEQAEMALNSLGIYFERRQA